MAYTQTDLDLLEKMIASGVLSTNDKDGRAVRYNSLTELIRARNFVAAQLGQGTASKTVYIRTNKALGGGSSESV